MTKFPLIAMSVLALTACGGSDDNSTTIATADGTMTIDNDDDGTMTIFGDDAQAVVKTGAAANGGTADNLPDGFTAYPGAKIVLSVEGSEGEGKQGGMIAMETSAPPGKVIAFYRKQAENAGMEIESEGRFSGSEVMGARGDGLGVNVVANGGDDGTHVQIAYGD